MTGSVASVKGFPGFGVYAASKAALRSFARTWLNELKGRNIRVNVLSPGQVDTPRFPRLMTAKPWMWRCLTYGPTVLLLIH
jgi:NAD(P)-dependent dehydrogenase (short-subunit alcohol dehydrogenase family)